MNLRLFKIVFIYLYVFRSSVVLATTKECIRIGLLGEFERKTGSFSQPFGKEILRGTEIAQQLNQPTSKCIQLERIDIDNSIANIDGLIRRASDRGIKIFLGLGTSAQAIAARQALRDTESLLISPTASADTIAISPSRTVLIFPTNSEIAEATAKELSRRGIKSIVSIFSSHNIYSENMNEAFKKYFKKAGGQVIDFKVNSGRMELDTQIEKIKAALSGYLFLPMFELDAAKVIAELSRNNLKPIYVGTDSWGTYSKVIKNLLKNSSMSAVLPQVYDPNAPYKQNQFFVSIYKKMFEESPSDLSAFSFDGVNLAVQISNSCTSFRSDKKLQECMARIKTLNTTMGKMRLSNDLRATRLTPIKFINLENF